MFFEVVWEDVLDGGRIMWFKIEVERVVYFDGSESGEGARFEVGHSRV